MRALRVLVVIVCAGLGFTGTGLLLITLVGFGGERVPDVDLDLVEMTRIVMARGDGSGERIVFLGDSLSFPSGGNAPSVPWIVGRRIRKQFDRPDTELIDFSVPGFTTFSHYFVSEEVAKVDADRVIVGVNLSWFSRLPSEQQPVLAGLLPASRWWEAARLPLHAIGLSAADLLTYRSLVAADFFEEWRWLTREQVRLAGRYSALVAMPSHLGAEDLVRKITRRRSTAGDARRRLGPVLDGLAPGNPDLLVLEALIKRYREAGSEVLLLIQPTNVARLIRLGLYDEARFGLSLARLREVAERQGSAFLDLHDLLPGRSFADEADHLSYGDETVPAGEVALRILPWALGDEDWVAQVAALPMVRAYRAEDVQGSPPP